MLELEYKKEILELTNEVSSLRTEISELKALVNALVSENEKLREENIFLKQENLELKDRVKFLENKLSLNSHNSSKPPSSDGFVKMTKSLRGSSGKKSGGQKGNKGKTLNMVETPDIIEPYPVNQCNYCGNDLSKVESIQINKRQVFDIPKIIPEVTEHQTEVKVCPCCNNETESEFPPEVSGRVQYGNRIKAFSLYLNNYQLLPYKRISDMLEELIGIRFNESTLYTANQELYEKLELSEAAIKELILHEKILNADETGFYVSKLRQWLHLYSTKDLTYYGFHEKRGQEAMDAIGILPNYNGRLVHDFWKSYFSYGTVHSLCNAHHLRELNFVSELEKAEWSKEMKELLLDIKKEVDGAKGRNEKGLSTLTLLNFEEKYESILEDGAKFYPEPEITEKKRGRKKQAKGKNLLDRLRDYREETLGFMYNFEIPFDNNQAERDVRMMKLKQKISGCFRTDHGAKFFCRIRGFLSTIHKQGLNILNEIFNALQGQPFTPAYSK